MRGRPWSPIELELLRSMYPECHTADVATWLDREIGSCYQAAAARGLRKSAEYLASDTAARIQRGRHHPNMIASRFKPGAAPWNKGKPGSAGLHVNSRRTQFKPGRPPQEARNYKPIGSLRISPDGALERKVTDDRTVYPARRWTPVSRLVCEAAFGPVPAGHIVVFRAGMATTSLDLITVERLECITRAENARRNHQRNKSPELAALVQLKGAITRQVNRITREAQESNGA